MRKIWLVVLLISVMLIIMPQPAEAQSVQPDQTVYDRLDAHLKAKLQQIRIPGLAIGVVQGDEIVYQRGYGIAGTTSGQVTPQTPFILGSVSKGVTALAVMQLVEADKLVLDAPVKRYLTWFEPTDIAVRHLLNQTSGFTARIMGKGGKQGKILFPVILLLAVAAFNLVGLPNLFGIPIRGMLLFSPDLSWPAVLAGAAAALGAVLFPILILLRARQMAKSAGAND